MRWCSYKLFGLRTALLLMGLLMGQGLVGAVEANVIEPAALANAGDTLVTTASQHGQMQAGANEQCQLDCQHCAQGQCGSGLCNVCVSGAMAAQTSFTQPISMKPCLSIRVRELPTDLPPSVELRPPRRLLQI